jgi:hypothetical protein
LAPHRDELLPAIYARGDKLRRRRRLGIAAGAVAGALVVAGASSLLLRDVSRAEVVPATDDTTTTVAITTTTTVPTTVGQPTTAPSAVPPSTQPGAGGAGACTRSVIAADLGIAVSRVERIRDCVDRWSLAYLCPDLNGYCPEGYAILQVVDGHWTFLGQTLQTCINELTYYGIPRELALQFKGYFDCDPPAEDTVPPPVGSPSANTT